MLQFVSIQCSRHLKIIVFLQLVSETYRYILWLSIFFPFIVSGNLWTLKYLSPELSIIEQLFSKFIKDLSSSDHYDQKSLRIECFRWENWGNFVFDLRGCHTKNEQIFRFETFSLFFQRFQKFIEGLSCWISFRKIIRFHKTKREKSKFFICFSLVKTPSLWSSISHNGSDDPRNLFGAFQYRIFTNKTQKQSLEMVKKRERRRSHRGSAATQFQFPSGEDELLPRCPLAGCARGGTWQVVLSSKLFHFSCKKYYLII